MVIKTFSADSSAAALKRVRSEMGGEAIVLKTNRVISREGKPVYEVTACLEQPTVGQSSSILDDSTPSIAHDSQPDGGSATNTTSAAILNHAAQPHTDTGDLNRSIAEIDRKLGLILKLGFRPDAPETFGAFQHVAMTLRKADFSDNFIDTFVAGLIESYDGKSDLLTCATDHLTEQLQQVIGENVSFEPGDRIAFVGSAGAGKTSALGKLAVSLVTERQLKVRLLTIDDIKMTAFDEVACYGEILGVEALDHRADISANPTDTKTITLIDTNAMPTDQQGQTTLQNKLNAVSPTHTIAVFSALARSRDCQKIMLDTIKLKPTLAVVTMLDATPAIGAVVSQLHDGPMKLVFLSRSSGGVGSLETPNARHLAESILGSVDHD